MSDDQLYIARESDIAVLQNHWEAANGGKATFLRLQSPFGGGRRAAVSEFLRDVEGKGESIVWRVNCLDQENGLQWLVRMYGSLMATLTGDVLKRGKAEMVLNAQLPGQPARVQGWYQQFIAALKEAKTDTEKGQVKLRLPQDNPLLGLVEIVAALSRKVPVFLEIQNPYAVHSLGLGMFVDALFQETQDGAKLLVVLFDEEESDTTKSHYPMPLLDVYARRDLATHLIAPWGAEETEKYLSSRGKSGNAARLAEIAGGRPGFIAELIDILEEEGDGIEGDLADISLAGLAPIVLDEDEWEAPEGDPDEGRTHATKEDVDRLVFLAALLGQAFPSQLVADMGGWDRDSVDEIIDAMGDLFEEVQYQQDMGSWIYKFARGSWREGVIERNDNEEGHQLARNVGVFMERYLVPRGYGFITKTARIYAEHQAYNRANLMRQVALTNDAPDIWGLAYDFTKYFDEIGWPDALRRTVYMNLLDNLVNQGSVQAAEKVHTEIAEWATDRDDKELTAWLLHAGSRLDSRRQDHFRARDRARDALALYEALGNTQRVAELHNHIANIELQDGNPNAALEAVQKALAASQVETDDGQVGVPPGVLANAEQIRGLVARRSGKIDDAINHFQRANEVAGQVGLAPLALDAGLAMGEALLAGRQIDRAREVLQRVWQIAQALKNPMRERSTTELLAQAEGAKGNFEVALQLAARTLELSKALKFEQVLPIDYYNLGFFHLANQKPAEALTFFRQTHNRIGTLGAQHPVVRELYYHMGIASLQVGNRVEAKQFLQQGLRPIQEAKDWRKMVSSLDSLASIEHADGNSQVARKLLADAIGFAKKGNLKDERKALRKKLDAMS